MAKKTDDVLNLKQAATVAGELLGERVSLYKLKKWIRFGALPSNHVAAGVTPAR